MNIEVRNNNIFCWVFAQQARRFSILVMLKIRPFAALIAGAFAIPF